MNFNKGEKMSSVVGAKNLLPDLYRIERPRGGEPEENERAPLLGLQQAAVIIVQPIEVTVPFVEPQQVMSHQLMPQQVEEPLYKRVNQLKSQICKELVVGTTILSAAVGVFYLGVSVLTHAGEPVILPIVGSVIALYGLGSYVSMVKNIIDLRKLLR